MSNTDLDGFGIVKKFPDLEGGITLEQGSNWGDTYESHGYKSIPGVTIKRKTFSFTKKLKPDQEMTIYVFLPGLNKEYFKGIEGIGHCESGSGHSIKLRGSTHPKVDKHTPKDVLMKTAKCYIFHYEYEGGNCNNFQKEYPHPEYTKFTLDKENCKKFNVSYGGNEFPNWIGKVMGFKAALLNTNDGKNVEFWSWFDPSAKIENGKLVTGNNWLLRYHGIDDGTNFTSKKNPRTDPPFLECHGDYTEFRMDNADEKTKAFCASLREIRRPSNQ
jgi:hypothetical protein